MLFWRLGEWGSAVEVEGPAEEALLVVWLPLALLGTLPLLELELELELECCAAGWWSAASGEARTARMASWRWAGTRSGGRTVLEVSGSSLSGCWIGVSVRDGRSGVLLLMALLYSLEL